MLWIFQEASDSKHQSSACPTHLARASPADPAMPSERLCAELHGQQAEHSRGKLCRQQAGQSTGQSDGVRNLVCQNPSQQINCCRQSVMDGYSSVDSSSGGNRRGRRARRWSSPFGSPCRVGVPSCPNWSNPKNEVLQAIAEQAAPHPAYDLP